MSDFFADLQEIKSKEINTEISMLIMKELIALTNE